MTAPNVPSRLLQRRDADGRPGVALAERDAAHVVGGVETTRELALAAGTTLAELADGRRPDAAVDLAAGHLLPAIDHPDAAGLMLAATGLTHLDSASGRDALHAAACPADLPGTSRIVRDGSASREKAFLIGEDNMSHGLHNLEAHHFRYSAFGRPGDIHVHFFGTATLPFADDVQTETGDVFEIEAAPFALQLCNPLARADGALAKVRVL